MARLKNDDDKYPEEVHPIDTRMVMMDTHYLLLQQSMRDARSLYRILMHFDSGNSIYIDKFEGYESNVVRMAQSLFNERSKSPVSLDQLKLILSAGESTLESLGDVKFNNEETLRMIQEINQLSEKRATLVNEINTTQTNIAKAKSTDFLRRTVGESLFFEYQQTGRVKIKGTNNAIYIIDKNGDIEKVKKGILGESSSWSGKINPGGFPFDDAVATVVTHIRNDSDKFDRDKGCGNISLSA